MKPDFITACPYCYAKNPKGRPSFLEHVSKKPRIVMCQNCGEMKAENGATGPKYCFAYHVMPGDS